MIRKILFGIVALLLITSVFYWELISYGIGQARGQLMVINGAEPIEDLLIDPEFPDSLKSKIQLIQEVRKFAVDAIGLYDSDNYTTLYDEKGEVTLWNLSACEPYSFTPKEWSFPLLGSFPYKGFFDLETAKKEREELRNDGWDVRIRPVGGWSTLGWFSDPIMSNMLTRNEGNLADLIIHELVHATLFVKDDIVFNENLASFVAEHGAIIFLETRFGKGSYELEQYIMSNEDSRTYTNHMLYCFELLDSLYNSYPESEPDSTKAFDKHLLIDEIIASVDTLHFHDNRYHKIFINGRPNNAYFMSFQRYHSSNDSLRNILSEQYGGDIKEFIVGMKVAHGKD